MQRSPTQPKGAHASGRVAALMVALMVALIAAAASPTAAFADDKARLEAGEIIVRTYDVPGAQMPRAKVWAVIDAPVERVWAIIDQCKDYKRTMVRVLESEELKREGKIVTCRTQIDMPWPIDDLEAITRATHTIEAGKRYQRAWTLVSGGYRRNDGSWTLTPWGDKPGRTLAAYVVLAEPKISVPTWILKKAARSTLPDLLTNLRLVSAGK